MRSRISAVIGGLGVVVACSGGDAGDGPDYVDTSHPRPADGGGDDGRSGDDGPAGDTGPRSHVVTATNPVLGVDHPDPDVVRVVGADGKPTYYCSATVDSGDITVFSSRDLVTWTQAPKGLFDRPGATGKSLALGDRHYCHLWAPQIMQLGPAQFLLSFTASRYATAQDPCPGYGEDGGVYWATATSPLGPFGDPTPFGAAPACATRAELPRSLDVVSGGCQGGFCHQIVRLDPHVFRDPKTGRAWAAYSWYTNVPPLVQFERDNYGEHVHVVELDASDPRYVRCDAATPQIFAANPHDAATEAKLAAYCPRCGEQLAFDRGRQDEHVVRDGYSWGVAEGASLIRRGDWVYLFVSGSIWDSGYYHVFFVAARTPEELAFDSPTRIVGRFLVPSADQSFGHGTPVLGPDGTSVYFLHHRLQHGPCKVSGSCARDVWLSPVEFEDRGDGNGDVWIKPRFPAEDPSVRVVVPD